MANAVRMYMMHIGGHQSVRPCHVPKHSESACRWAYLSRVVQRVKLSIAVWASDVPFSYLSYVLIVPC